MRKLEVELKKFNLGSISCNHTAGSILNLHLIKNLIWRFFASFIDILIHEINMSTSLYAKRMAQLSARIFGEILVEKNSPNGRIVQRLAQKPIYKMEEYSMNYYPRQQEMDHLFKVLRYHGLYR